MQEITMYKAEDGNLFDSYDKAHGHEELVAFKKVFKSQLVNTVITPEILLNVLKEAGYSKHPTPAQVPDIIVNLSTTLLDERECQPGAVWSTEDESALVLLLLGRKSSKQIGKILGRSIGSIRSRTKQLGLWEFKCRPARGYSVPRQY